MHFYLVLFLHYAVARLVHSAPISEFSGESGIPMEDPEFQLSVEASRSLVEKILSEINDTHNESVHLQGLTLENSENLSKMQYVLVKLGIPQNPTINPVSHNFTLETCLSRVSEGLQQQQSWLEAILLSDLLSAGGSQKVEVLKADIRDLLSQIKKMQKKVNLEVQLVAPVELQSRLTAEYDVQVATHVTLLRLKDFAQDMHRSLRAMTSADPEVADE